MDSTMRKIVPLIVGFLVVFPACVLSTSEGIITVSNLTYHAGDVVILRCDFPEKARNDILAWHFRNSTVHNVSVIDHPRYGLAGGFDLRISPVALDDSGNFTCCLAHPDLILASYEINVLPPRVYVHRLFGKDSESPREGPEDKLILVPEGVATTTQSTSGAPLITFPSGFTSGTRSTDSISTDSAAASEEVDDRSSVAVLSGWRSYSAVNGDTAQNYIWDGMDSASSARIVNAVGQQPAISRQISPSGSFPGNLDPGNATSLQSSAYRPLPVTLWTLLFLGVCSR